MSRKLLSVALAMTLLISVLAACGSGNNKPAATNAPTAAPTNAPQATDAPPQNQYGDTGGLTLPLVDKPTKLTWMLVSESPVNGKLITEEIKKRTGIELDIQAYSSATYQDKLRLTVASGKLPDIFHGLKPAELNSIGKQGAVVAITDYVDMLPNFKKLYIEDNPWVTQSYGDEEGNLYAWPIHNLNRDVNHGFLFRKDIFDQHGIKEWTNTDEFIEALRALKKAYPDSYPLASKGKEYIFRDYSYGWGIGGTSYPAAYDEAKKEWKFAPTSQEHKAMLDFFKQLYNEGLLDPEFLTDTLDNWTAKMTTDKSFVTFDWIGRLDLFYNQVKDANPNYNLRYGNPVGPTGNIRSLPKIDVGFSIAVANNANKEVALKLLDYLTSPSGAQLVTLGVEGETFNFDANGKPVYPELANEPLVDIKLLDDRYGLWLEGMYLNPDRRAVYYNFTEKEQEAQDKINALKAYEPLDPVLKLTDEETAKIAELQTALEKVSHEFNAKYVLNKNYGDKEWNEWVASAEKQGAAEFAKVYNDAQKRFDAK